jgi:hypothetical protein
MCDPIAERGLRDAKHNGCLAQASHLADHPDIEEIADVHEAPPLPGDKPIYHRWPIFGIPRPGGPP